MTAPAFDSLAALEATVARLERVYASGRETHPHLPWPPKDSQDRTGRAPVTQEAREE